MSHEGRSFSRCHDDFINLTPPFSKPPLLNNSDRNSQHNLQIHVNADSLISSPRTISFTALASPCSAPTSAAPRTSPGRTWPITWRRAAAARWSSAPSKKPVVNTEWVLNLQLYWATYKKLWKSALIKVWGWRRGYALITLSLESMPCLRFHIFKVRFIKAICVLVSSARKWQSVDI